jgi:hypothetical protein
MPEPYPETELQQTLHELGGRLQGSLIEPQDPLYEEARAVWNGMIDLRPRAIARAGALPDIDAVLDYARRTGLALAVRGGGHNIAGHGTVDGGLVLDLGALRCGAGGPASHCCPARRRGSGTHFLA